MKDKDKIRSEEEEESLDRQRATREEGRSRRAARKAEKQALSEATSTKERREIKEEFERIQESIEEGAIFDVDTGKLNTNQSSTKETINDDGIDKIEPLNPAEGFSEETLDVVAAGNSAVQRVFLTKTV